jgi:ABC-type amino acid transport substrate-binding protein
MSGRGALGALAGGLGLVVGVVILTVTAAIVLVGLSLPEAGRADDGPTTIVLEPTPRPHALVIALRLGDARLQAGVVRDGEVVLARGLEVDVARALTRRLRMRSASFLDLEQLPRLHRGGGAEWHLGVTTVRSARQPAAAGAAVSAVYLPTGAAVVQRRRQRAVRTLTELRGMHLCASRGSEAARIIRSFSRLAHPPVVTLTSDRLFQLVQTGACDAALVDGLDLGAFVAGRRGLLGPIAARVDRGEGLAVAVAKDSGLRVDEVNRALRRLRADGTLSRLARAWLRVDPTALRPLR